MTNELKELIQRELKKLCDRTYFENADSDAMYPHIVYSMSSVDTGDEFRGDYVIDIRVWDRSDSTYAVDELTDKIEAFFRENSNQPQEKILPTFYNVSRKTVADEDKKIRHREVSVVAQVYENK